ncbi:MAG: hypothetical protein IIA88_12150 [Bacteroidetes bacterium]|nr:hypothetical protein [Bacteroidota bacterium]
MNNTIKLFFDTKSVVDDKRGVNLYKIIGETELRGVIPKKECVLTVKVGIIKLRLVDPINTTDTLEIKSYLAPIDNVPLVIGFEKLLSEFDVFFSYASQNAFIKAAK